MHCHAPSKPSSGFTSLPRLLSPVVAVVFLLTDLTAPLLIGLTALAFEVVLSVSLRDRRDLERAGGPGVELEVFEVFAFATSFERVFLVADALSLGFRAATTGMFAVLCCFLACGSLLLVGATLLGCCSFVGTPVFGGSARTTAGFGQTCGRGGVGFFFLVGGSRRAIPSSSGVSPSTLPEPLRRFEGG